jgi:hypothetical protein
MMHFFSIFHCELAQNLFLALLLPKAMHICKSEFYFVAYQKLQCEGLLCQFLTDQVTVTL